MSSAPNSSTCSRDRKEQAGGDIVIVIVVMIVIVIVISTIVIVLVIVIIVRWDEKSGEHWIELKEGGEKRTVFYPTQQSIQV